MRHGPPGTLDLTSSPDVRVCGAAALAMSTVVRDCRAACSCCQHCSGSPGSSVRLPPVWIGAAVTELSLLGPPQRALLGPSVSAEPPRRSSLGQQHRGGLQPSSLARGTERTHRHPCPRAPQRRRTDRPAFDHRLVLIEPWCPELLQPPATRPDTQPRADRTGPCPLLLPRHECMLRRSHTAWSDLDVEDT